MKKIILGLSLLVLLYEPVYAFSITNNEYTFSMVFAAGFILVGLLIIIMSKLSGGSKEVYIEKEKNLISGLTDKEKLEETKGFNPDSIFKTLPTFSSKKFEDNIKNIVTNLYTGNSDQVRDLVENRLLNTETLNNLKITDYKITGFIEENDQYIITSKVLIEYDKKNKSTLNITSINKKVVHDEVRCPVCGGKIKDITKLRCTYCGTILPNNTEINNDKWIVYNIEKI